MESDWIDIEETQPQESSVATPFLRAFPNFKKQEQFITKEAPAITEQEISKRPSMIADLIKDPTTLERFKQHPLGTALRSILGGYEYMSGIPADIGLGIQQRKGIKGTVEDIGKTLVGERPAQMSDVFTASGLPVISTKPFALPAGMGLEALKGTPTASFGEITTKPIVDSVKYLGGLAKQVGMPTITKAMKFMANIPESHSEFAINNPDLLQTNTLKQFGKTASKAIEDVVVPLEDNPKAIIDLTPTTKALDELRVLTKNTRELTSQAAKLSDSEQKTIKNIMDELQLAYGKGKNPTFARVRSLLGKMDDILSPTYKKRYAGIEPVSDAFQNYVGYIRGALRKSINETNYPEADAALKQYSKYEMAKNVSKSFDKMSVSFMRSIPIRLAIMGLATGIKSPLAGLAAMPLTMPIAYKGMIGGIDLGQKILSEPTITMEMLRASGLEKPKQDEWVDVQ